MIRGIMIEFGREEPETRSDSRSARRLEHGNEIVLAHDTQPRPFNLSEHRLECSSFLAKPVRTGCGVPQNHESNTRLPALNDIDVDGHRFIIGSSSIKTPLYPRRPRRDYDYGYVAPIHPYRRKFDEQPPQGLNPLEPKAPVSLLPPEIWDEILGYIPTDRKGRLTLIACALVATWWMEPSQRRLFSSVKINDQNRERWISGVILSESRNRLLQYIRSLQRFLSGYRYPLQKLLKGSGEYLSALRSLELANVRIERLDKELHSSFSAFRETLTNLTLKSFTTSFTALIALVDYFPNITSLQLGWLSRLEPDEGPFPLLSQPLRGRIHICPPLPHCLEFIDRFAKLDQEYEELVIDSATVALRTEYLERILQFSAGTVKHLRLLGELDRDYSFHTPFTLYVLTQPFTP